MYEKCDSLSSKRDALTIQGRPDIKCQVYDRSFDKSQLCYMPPDTVKRIMRFAEELYPDPGELPEACAASFISCEQAVELQERIYDEGSRILKVYFGGNKDTHVERLFIPPWPTHLVKVHPGDGYGQRFFRVEERDIWLWMLLSVCAHVHELWCSLAESVDDNIHWTGHWMRYAASALKMKVNKKGDSWFKLKKKREISQLFNPSLDQILSDYQLAGEFFGRCKDVIVLGPADTSTDDSVRPRYNLEKKNVVICFEPDF